jgi:hypothetical protein
MKGRKILRSGYKICAVNSLKGGLTQDDDKETLIASDGNVARQRSPGGLPLFCYACNQATNGHASDATRCEHCKRVLWEAVAQPCSSKPLRDIPYKQLCKWGATGKGAQKMFDLEPVPGEERK